MFDEVPNTTQNTRSKQWLKIFRANRTLEEATQNARSKMAKNISVPIDCEGFSRKVALSEYEAIGSPHDF